MKHRYHNAHLYVFLLSGIIFVMVFLLQVLPGQAARSRSPNSQPLVSDSVFLPLIWRDSSIKSEPTVTSTDQGTPSPTPAPTATATVAPSETPTTSPTPTPTVVYHTWEVIDSPNINGQDTRLEGLAAISESDIWAVGSSWDTGNLPKYAVTMHWDGVNWTLVDSPSPDPDLNSLVDADAVSSTDVWAVGQMGGLNGPDGMPLTLHWDGQSWIHIAVPAFDEPVNAGLRAVDTISSSDVWAVGQYSGPSTGWWDQPLILHWDGSTWSQIPAPQFGVVSVLSDVDAVAPDDVWVVGYTYAGTTQALILHWDGSTWSQSPAPVVSNSDRLFGVAVVSPDDVWAVGSKNNGSQTLILHWDGSAWSVVPSPNGDYPNINRNELLRLSVVSPDEIWAAGKSALSTLCGGGDAPLYWSYVLYARWDGSVWTTVPGPNPSSGGGCLGTRNELGDIEALSSGNAWSLGAWYDADLSDQVWKSLIERYLVP